MREKYIEQKLVKTIKAERGIALKLQCIGFDGMPDRIILMPGGRLAFAEIKAPGEKLRPLQERRKRQIESLGFLVFVIDSIDKIEPFMEVMKGEVHTP